MYGIQALAEDLEDDLLFENDVKMYGIQAVPVYCWEYGRFENDVKMYGIQASMINYKPL